MSHAQELIIIRHNFLSECLSAIIDCNATGDIHAMNVSRTSQAACQLARTIVKDKAQFDGSGQNAYKRDISDALSAYLESDIIDARIKDAIYDYTGHPHFMDTQLERVSVHNAPLASQGKQEAIIIRYNFDQISLAVIRNIDEDAIEAVNSTTSAASTLVVFYMANQDKLGVEVDSINHYKREIHDAVQAFVTSGEQCTKVKGSMTNTKGEDHFFEVKIERVPVYQSKYG